ncbi:hypothetical protein D0O09_30185, partial [Pseudomonas putida]
KCNCAWRSNHLRLEQLMDTAVGRVTGRRAVPVLHDTLMLCGMSSGRSPSAANGSLTSASSSVPK